MRQAWFPYTNFVRTFLSILKLLFKWMAAGFIVVYCFIPAVMVVFLIVMAIFGSLLHGIFGGFGHP